MFGRQVLFPVEEADNAVKQAPEQVKREILDCFDCLLLVLIARPDNQCHLDKIVDHSEHILQEVEFHAPGVVQGSCFFGDQPELAQADPMVR